MSENLPPKTCSIDRMITQLEDVKLVMEGKKTATRRNGRYADPGEIMELGGKRYKVTNVYRQLIGELTDADAEREGYQDVETYKQYILSMHPGMPWMPQMPMWVHEFEEERHD
ncbi:ASCH domain-containing protein [Aneurinibacillus terranovensis]|uniref:ASCH domain-containing protein n=1 Tax=Aneurinibacillus terranovensis TaxID=278991 RepID=UPI0004213595|nr:ASCH domain-containing protein [Aneurinibacillus terranovensis]